MDELKRSVSPICNKDGKKYAFVTFTDGVRSAEGKIPDCTIISNKGFSKDEEAALVSYMQKELASIKHMAAGVDVIGAVLK